MTASDLLKSAAEVGMEKAAVGARAKFLARLLNPGSLDDTLARSFSRRLASPSPQGVPVTDLVRTQAGRRAALKAPIDLSTPPGEKSLAGLLSVRDAAPAPSGPPTPWQARMREAAKPLLDAEAMSGRHAGRRVPFAATPTPELGPTGQPAVAYKGVAAPGPVLPGKPADPFWWSAHPDVASGYAGPGGLVLRAPVDALKSFGPAGPFTPHVAVDGRSRWSPAAVTARLRSWLQGRAAGNSAAGNRPFYEAVFTRPPDEQAAVYGGPWSVFKPLPSGQGYQQVR